MKNNDQSINTRRVLPALLAVVVLGLLLAGAWMDAAAQAASGEGTQASPIAAASPQPDSTVWGANYRANSDYSGPQYSQHEPHLAISRTNPDVIVVVAKDYRIGNNKEVWIYVSHDGGQTWPVEWQRQIPGMPADIPNQSDPVAMARDDGRLYVFALGHNNGHGLFVTWSDDDGVTWLDPSIAITYNETPGGLDDKEWPAIDNNPASPYYHNIYVAWATDGIQFKRSTDGGLTWSPIVNLTPGDGTEYPYPVVAADGSLYVFYMDGWGYCADGYIKYRKSSDGGATFGAEVTVVAASQPCSPIHGGGFDQFRFFSIITAAANPLNSQELYVSWTDDNGIQYGKTDVLYAHSTDGGVTWRPPARLSHDDPVAYRDHITPVFAFSETGRLHAFWLDRRDDPSNQLWHGYHTSTLDGVTWEEDNQVSTQAFDLNLYFPPPSGYNAAGDYWGLDVVGNVVMAAWNTTVETSQDIYVARGLYSLPVTLTGQVVDAATSLPIDGAQVLLDNGLYTYTNPAGVYLLNLDPGVYTATASAAGYYSQVFTDVAVLTDVVTLDFALTPLPPEPVSLSGQVTDADTSLPIAGAELMLNTGVFTTTDAVGMYAFSLPPDVYTVTASASGYYLQTAAVELVADPVVLDFALTPIPPEPPAVYTLTGQVADADTMLPLAGAEVSLDTGPLTTTNAAGIYTFTLEAGTYTVTAQAAGYYSQTAVAELVSGTLALDFALPPIPIPPCPLPVIQGVEIAVNDLTAAFTPTISATLPITSYLWDFGDSLTSTLPAPSHPYAGYGTYTVTLQAANACGLATWEGQVHLQQMFKNYFLPVIVKNFGL
jgi:hypothetical protein